METPANIKNIKIECEGVVNTLRACISHKVDESFIQELVLDFEKSRPKDRPEYIIANSKSVGILESIIDIDGVIYARVNLLDNCRAEGITLHPTIRISKSNLFIINIDGSYF